MQRAIAALCIAACGAVAGGEGRDTPLAGWFDLPVPGGAGTLEALGIPLDERALTLPILSRASYDRESRTGRAPGRLTHIMPAITAPAVGAVTDVDPVVIPAPLSADTWRDLLVPQTDDLFVGLVTDRSALLLASALMATDDSVRALVSRDRDLLRFLHREAAGAFSVVARRLRLQDGRVAVPGGPGADRLWERLAGSPPSRPTAFLRALVTRDAGRLAWYFDTMAGMDDDRLAAAWPSGSPDARRVQAQAQALYEPFRDSDPQWSIADQPYRRSYADPWTVLMLSELRDGRPVGPAGTSLLDVVRSTATGSLRDRRDKADVFFLGQRAFPRPTPDELPFIASALDGFDRYRALLLGVERMEIFNARTWAAAVKAADHVTSDADDRTESVIAFQAVIGLIERARHVRTIDPATADRVLQTLFSAVQVDNRVSGSVAGWIKESLIPALPRLERPDAFTSATAYESTILQALAGPRQRPTPSIEWEGLRYTVDLVAAEHDRLRAIRSQLPSPGLDAALLTGKPRDLASALTALVYTPALGEPGGPVTLSREIATRHDLGFGGTSIIRDTRPWSPPEERQGLGAWHVQGALIGLDLALSRLALRRITDQQMPPAPTLTLNDFGTLTRTVIALVPLELTDPDRDELARAIARGRERVAEAGGDIARVRALAREAQVSAVTQQLLPWLASRQPERIADIFTLRDLMWLGRPVLTRQHLDRWGMAAEGLDGRRVPAMPRPAPWEDFAGRSDVGQIATQAPDLTLRLVEETARLKLPAQLIPSLLAFAVNDYWHDVQARFVDDWWRMTRQARALQSARVEDYVAALSGGGPLRTQ